MELRDIKGYEGLYSISNDGSVYSPAKGTSNPRGKFLRLNKDHNGYPKVVLRKDGKKLNHSVHRLVAEAWIENSKSLPCVNHINAIKTDNRIENLEWLTVHENVLHAECLGLRRRIHGEEHMNSKLSNLQVIRLKKQIKEGISQYTLASEYGVSQATISNIKCGVSRQIV